jgi:hypothetical protein
MTAPVHCYLVEGIINATLISLGLLRGKPQIWFSESDDSGALVLLTLRASFWSRHCLEVVLRWSGVTLSASTTTSLSSVEQRGLDGGRMMTYNCRAKELSGVVVALIVGAVISHEDGFAESDGGNRVC